MTALSLDISNFAYRMFNTIENMFKSTTESAKMQNSIKQTIRELNALSDRDLIDIGITRGDIEEIARNHAKTLS